MLNLGDSPVPLDNPQEKGSVFMVDTLNPGVAILTKEPSTSSGLGASAGMGGHAWVPEQTRLCYTRTNSHCTDTQTCSNVQKGERQGGGKTKL